ncbi:DUF1801 domain-containing protein [Fibrella sp. ES10-3-2-2]|nr:hypothetical protein A6C57_15980 [Fibrella sp. ES10-3-2-2]
MSIEEQIDTYIASQPEPKRSDIRTLHQLACRILPAGNLWFNNGTNSEGRIINNPTIGYGLYAIKYASGKTNDFFQIGLSATQTGISIYILGIDDKTYLAKAYGKTIGKATVSGYCIRFKKLNDINTDVLEAAIRFGVEASCRA